MIKADVEGCGCAIFASFGFDVDGGAGDGN